VSRTTTTGASSGDMRTILAASANNIAACSFDCAAEKSCELGRAFGPQRCTSSSSAESDVLPFLRPKEIIARRVGES